MKKTLFVLLAAIMLQSVATAAEYDVDKSQKNLVKFTSDAQIDKFDGVTDRIDGYVLLPSDALTPGANYDSSKVYFQVELNGLDTGIGLRNRHMRENYLQTDKYPVTHFEGKIVKIDKGQGADNQITVAGNLFIHGVTQPVTTTGTVNGDGKTYRVKTAFIVKLTDYNIAIPSLMFLKLSNLIQLNLDFYVKAASK